jgi:hypothetical protein
MLGTFFTIGDVGDLTAYVGTLFSDAWLVIALAIGIPLAFYVIKRVIALVPKAGGGGRRGV